MVATVSVFLTVGSSLDRATAAACSIPIDDLPLEYRA